MIALLLLFHGRMVNSEKSPPVTPLIPSEDVEYDNYIVYDFLEKATNTPFNLYTLRETFFSDELTLCLPVTYHLHCENEASCSSSSCRGIFPLSRVYLWTLFDTEGFTGKFLLFFTKNRLKSPLLSIPDHFCHFSSEKGIFLYLNVKSFPTCLEGNVSAEDVISKTLLKITRRVSLIKLHCKKNLIVEARV